MIFFEVVFATLSSPAENRRNPSPESRKQNPAPTIGTSSLRGLACDLV